MRFLTVLLVVMLPVCLRAQDWWVTRDGLTVSEIVVLSDPVHRILAREWDRKSRNPLQYEAGYCLVGRTVDLVVRSGFQSVEAVRVHYVTAVSKAESVSMGSVRTLSFRCKPTEGMMHTHPPATCRGGTNERPLKCAIGGVDAWQCHASMADKMVLVGFVQRGWTVNWAVVQCDRNAFILYSYHPDILPVGVSSDSAQKDSSR